MGILAIIVPLLALLGFAAAAIGWGADSRERWPDEPGRR